MKKYKSEEKEMNTINYMTSLLTFYLKGEIKSEQNFIVIKTPNTIFKLIPLGKREEKYIINQIASTTTNFNIKIGSLIGGLFLALLAFSFVNISIIFVVIMLLIGINTIIGAFDVKLVISMTSGQFRVINFLVFEKSKAKLAEMQINNMITGRLDDTNTRQQTDRIIDAINNK